MRQATALAQLERVKQKKSAARVLLLQPGALGWANLPHNAYSRRQVSSHSGGYYTLPARSVFQFHCLDTKAIRRPTMIHGNH